MSHSVCWDHYSTNGGAFVNMEHAISNTSSSHQLSNNQQFQAENAGFGQPMDGVKENCWQDEGHRKRQWSHLNSESSAIKRPRLSSSDHLAALPFAYGVDPLANSYENNDCISQNMLPTLQTTPPNDQLLPLVNVAPSTSIERPCTSSSSVGCSPFFRTSTIYDPNHSVSRCLMRHMI